MEVACDFERALPRHQEVVGFLPVAPPRRQLELTAFVSLELQSVAFSLRTFDDAPD